MDETNLDGITEIGLFEATFSNDIMLAIVILLLSLFAWIFRMNAPLLGKLIGNISASEQRQSIFKTTENDTFLFNSFMTCQTILLCSVFLFSIAVKYQYIPHPDTTTTFLFLALFFVLFFLFFLLKNALYALFGTVFVEKAKNIMMFTNFQALFCLWGVTLYLPVLWVLLYNTHLFVGFIILFISFLAYKAVLSLRFFYIFYNKNTGFLFFCLYLCAQEIVPLVLFYKGMVYIYRIIETNFTWQ